MVKIRKKSIKKGSKDLKDLKKTKPEKKPVKKDRRIELNSREFRINLEKLKHDVKDAYETMAKVLPEAIKDAEVKRFGNAAHIILPKEYAGKKATVLIKKR